MEKEFMKLLKVYIDKMQEQWNAGEYYKIHTLAVAIADMTKYSDMLDIVAGQPEYRHETIQALSRAAKELTTEDQNKGEH